MQLKRSLLALFLTLAYFTAAAVALYAVSLPALAKLLFVSLYVALLFISIKTWLASSGFIMEQGDKLTLTCAKKDYILHKPKYHLDCCVCCEVLRSRKTITIWRDQLHCDDYRRLRGLLLALK